MSDPQKDQQLQMILSQIGKFGFQFYAYDESGVPLVKGPNNQIVNVNLAIQFVNEQINRAKSSNGSPENPDFDESMDSKSSPETSVETKIESAAESAENQEKQKEDSAQSQTQDLTVKPQSPPIAIQQPVIKPYQDGFDPKSFDPSSIASTLNFVEKNSKLSAKSSNKWLAEQFKKFVEEFKAGNQSN
jgi:hypothetical protein